MLFPAVGEATTNTQLNLNPARPDSPASRRLNEGGGGWVGGHPGEVLGQWGFLFFILGMVTLKRVS